MTTVLPHLRVDSPVGPLRLTSDGEHLTGVWFEEHRHGPRDVGPATEPAQAPAVLLTAARQLEEYFAGTRTRFDLPLDRSLSHGFRRLVQEHLPEIGYGRTESYGAVARSVGRPQAVRAVGTACATNPLPVVVPCHRVLRGDGGLGGYVGGPEAKSALLELEAAA